MTDTPAVVLAADENFAMPLAVTVRSALEHLPPGAKLELYVLDGGIEPATKQRIEASWPADKFELQWVAVDPAVFDALPVVGRISHVAYFRVLLTRLLPESLGRVIYLDSDLLVLADLTRLWQIELDGALALAVQDCAAPYIDAHQVPSVAKACQYFGSATPIANYAELGLDPRAPYFNSGVMIIDVDAWRRERVSEQLIDCLEQNKDHIRWWDQYALNVVLAGRWRELDPRWNQGATLFTCFHWSHSHYDRPTFAQVCDDPWIVHFTTEHKPWKVTCLHPRRRQFFEVVDRTLWAGWRPPRFSDSASFVQFLKTQNRRARYALRRLFAC